MGKERDSGKSVALLPIVIYFDMEPSLKTGV
jgi:hypothetical protein